MGAREMPDSLGLEGTWETVYLDAKESRLRALVGGSPAAPPLLFVAGWASTPRTWRAFLPVLAREWRVYYVESREKSSALPGRLDQALELASEDIAIILGSLGADRPVASIGASTGANLLLLAVAAQGARTSVMALMGPHANSPVPSHTRILDVVPAPLLPAVRNLILFIARSRFLPTRYKQQQDGLAAAVEASDLRRLRDSSRAWRSHSAASLQAHHTPSIVVAVESDPVHLAEDSRLVAERNRSSVLSVRNFAEMHAAPTAERISGALQETAERVQN